jgi:hypothetical protein
LVETLKDVVSCAILEEFSSAMTERIVDGRDAAGTRRHHQIIETALDVFVALDSIGVITDWKAQNWTINDELRTGAPDSGSQ